jgi:hypothetical protein
LSPSTKKEKNEEKYEALRFFATSVWLQGFGTKNVKAKI